MSIAPCLSKANVMAMRTFVVERRLLAIDEQIGADARWHKLARRFGGSRHTSPMNGTVMSATNVRSNSLAANARTRVERLPMMLNSTPSR